MTRRTAPVLALALTACLAACSDEPDLSGTSATRASAAPSGSPAPVQEPSETASTPAAGDAEPFEADTAPDEQQASGGPLTVTKVRVARQDGYDRVVFELAGKVAGEPGWRVEYVEQATQDGSGEPVDVEGAAYLAVRVQGAGYPGDTGQEEASSASVPGDVEVVQDVELGAVFEGVYEAWIGTSRKAPFRVFRLADPARIVVDVRHG